MFFKRKIVLYLPLINNRDRESHKLIFMPVKLRLQRHGKKENLSIGLSQLTLELKETENS